MKTELQPGESHIKSGGANLQRGLETVGGHLHLTSQRLVFESHKVNVQRGSTEIPLTEIGETQPVWTKFLNLIPLAPNSLAVVTRSGEEHRFVLSGRGKWQAAIDQASHA